MKSIEYYQYSTARIHITWNGHIQPVGRFKTATAANKWINENDFLGNFDRYKIVTPDGELDPAWDPQPQFNPFATDKQ